MNNNMILTQSQAAEILSINENTITALVYSGQIPHLRVPNPAGGTHQLCFNFKALVDWFNAGPTIKTNNQNDVNRLKHRLAKQYPEALSMLKNYDRQFIPPRKSKGYNLTKVANKKIGFIYYVRYIDKGRLVPTRWSTHTNDLAAAANFAILNRDRLLSEYIKSKTKIKTPNKLYAIMKNYYEKDSIYQKSDKRRGRSLSDGSRKIYHNTILHHWIPFLKTHRISTLDEIDTPLMVYFQDHCMDKGIKPQSVNHYICFISHIFDYLILKKNIEKNPCNGLLPLGVEEEEYEIRGCYIITELRGVFNRRWDDEVSFLLCLIIYSTGMRNSEIDRIQVKDIIQIKTYRFIDIPKSKTKYGVRIVPLHDFVYGKLIRYIKKTKKGPEDLLICQDNGKPVPRQWYTDANIALGKFTNRDKTMLKKENITFYSGRHFWKTMVNANDLGDVEEYFMGHKVSNDVAKRYNHRDKQGQERIAKKAREVFRILDKILFNAKYRAGKTCTPYKPKTKPMNRPER